jgi:phenylpropionate dioxygenase-like ring-hydroxylating dioxygenase large terminal subunit
MNDLSLAALRNDYWHLIGHRCQVAQPGQFIKLDWFDEEIVAYNDHGDVLVFDNVCPHRGARIFTEREGSRRLRCDYHGWSYQRGRFLAPFPSDLDEAQVRDARFNVLQHEWCGDFLFAGIAPRRSLRDQLGGLKEILIEIGASIAQPFATDAFVWESDWQIGVENAIEQYHTAVGIVHPATFGKHRLTTGEDEFFSTNSVYRCEYVDQRTNRQLQRLRRHFDLTFQHPGYLSILVFPFAMIGSTYGYSYALQHFFPGPHPNTSHFSTRMLTARLSSDAKPEVLEPFFESTRAMNRLIFDEDHAICRRVSPKSLGRSFRPVLAASEAKIARFRTWLDEAAPPSA